MGRKHSRHAHAQHARAKNRSLHPGRRVVAIAFVAVATLVVVSLVGTLAVINAGRQSLVSASENPSYAQTVKSGNKTYVLNPHVATILFLGVDKDNGRVTPPYNGQADAVMALALNEDTGKITCLAVSRSSWVPVLERDFGSGQVQQADNYLCLGYSYGYDDENSALLMCQDVSDLLGGVPIDSYYTLNMSGVGALANAVGGVSLTALSDVVKTDIKEGDQLELHGDLARDYVWQRDVADDYSSAERLERQEQFAKAFAKEAFAMCKDNPFELFRLFDVAEEHSVTDLGFPELAYLASFFAVHGVDDVQMVALPGEYVANPPEPTKFVVDDAQALQMVLDIFYTEVE